MPPEWEKVSATPVAVVRMGFQRSPKRYSPSALRRLCRRKRLASVPNPTFRIQD